MRRRALLTITPLAAVALVATACGGTSAGSTTSGSGASSAASSSAPNSTPVNLTLMVGGLNKIFYMPATLADRLGYFKQQGLNVKILDVPAGAGQVVDTLLTGQSQANVSFYDHAVAVGALGKHIESIAVLDNVPGEVLLVQKKYANSITSAKDLAGMKIGVTSIGGGGEWLARYIANRAGLKQSQITIVGVGEGSSAIAAMKAGRVQAEVQGDPGATEMVSQGIAKVLLDMRTTSDTKKALGGLYPGGDLYAQNSYVEAHPQTVQKIVNAFAETLRWIHSHTAAQIAAKMPADYAGGNPTLYAQAIKNSLPMFSTNGLMPSNGPQTVWDVFKAFDPKYKNATVNLSQTYTNQFVQKALSSGY